MDIGRYPAARPCRFHTGAGAPVAEILWYETTLKKCVEETIINRREWDNERFVEYPVGEMPHFGKYRDFATDGGMRAGLDGKHQCHPEWFATGEPWPTDLPDTIYNPNGIPRCCGLFQEPADGGVVFGGEAGEVFTAVEPTGGGVVFGGEAGERVTYTEPTGGGVVFGGEAGEVFTATEPTEGGVVFGGEAGEVFTGPPTYRAHATTTDARTTVNLPSAIVPGEKLFILLTVNTGGTLPAAPTGWTTATSNNTTTPQYIIFQRTADGSEGATVGWSTTGGSAVATSYAITNGTAFGASHLTGILIGRNLNYTNNSLTPTGSAAVLIQWIMCEDAALTAVNTDTIDASLTGTGLLNNSAGAGNKIAADTGYQNWGSGSGTGTRTSLSSSSPSVTGRGFMFLVD